MEMNMFCGYRKWPLFHVLELTFILSGNCNFIQRPVDTTVFVGDSTYLNCSVSNSASAHVFWYHFPVGEGTSMSRYVYSSGKILHPYAGRFKIEKGVSTGEFNLVLTKTELHDAGFYVCQIGGTEGSAIAQLTVLGNSTFIERPVDTEVLLGGSTYLNCSISSSAPAEVFWYHFPVGEGTSKTRSVYSSGKIFNPYKERFGIEKGALKEIFDLVIKRAKLCDAGFYVCAVTTKWAIAQLTVLESGPLLLTNIRPSGFIGRNSCGLKRDTIRLSCGIRYKGNVTPKLQMTLVQVQNGEPVAVNESHLSCSSSDVSVNCNYSIVAENVMNGSFFICYTNTSENSHLKNRSEIIKILYLMDSRVTELKSLGEEVECPLHGNAEDRCSYKWFWSTDVGQELISTDRTLTITEDRRYRCITTCYIKGNKCVIDAILIETKSVDPAAWLVGMALSICFMVLFYLLL